MSSSDHEPHNEPQPVGTSDQDSHAGDPASEVRQDLPLPETTVVSATTTLPQSDPDQIPPTQIYQAVPPPFPVQTGTNNPYEAPQQPIPRQKSAGRDEPPARRSWPATALMAGAAGLVIGLGGVWAYSYLTGSKTHEASGAAATAKPDRGGNAPSTGGKSISESSSDAASGADTIGDRQTMRQQIEELSGQLAKMRQQIETLSQPRNSISPDLQTLPNKVAEISRRIADMGDVQSRMLQMDHRLENLQQDIKNLWDRPTISTAIPPAVTGSEAIKEAAKQVAASATSVIAEAAGGGGDAVLKGGIALLKAGKYPAAEEIFRKLQTSQPSDPRVWYLSALAFGLRSGDWNGGAMALLEKGVEREKQGTGTVSKTAVDAVLNDLTTAQGRDWLQGYRKLKLNP